MITLLSYADSYVVTFVYFNKQSNNNQGKIYVKLSKENIGRKKMFSASFWSA